MTNLAPFSAGVIECNPHDPTRPSAVLTVDADSGAKVRLSLYWIDGRPVAKWKVGGQHETGGGRPPAFMEFVFGQLSMIQGDEWKHAQRPATTTPAAETLPRPTAVIAQLLPLALAWEEMPVRSADRLARAVHRTLTPIVEEAA